MLPTRKRLLQTHRTFAWKRCLSQRKLSPAPVLKSQELLPDTNANIARGFQQRVIERHLARAASHICQRDAIHGTSL